MPINAQKLRAVLGQRPAVLHMNNRLAGVFGILNGGANFIGEALSRRYPHGTNPVVAFRDVRHLPKTRAVQLRAVLLVYAMRRYPRHRLIVLAASLFKSFPGFTVDALFDQIGIGALPFLVELSDLLLGLL